MRDQAPVEALPEGLDPDELRAQLAHADWMLALAEYVFCPACRAAYEAEIAAGLWTT